MTAESSDDPNDVTFVDESALSGFGGDYEYDEYEYDGGFHSVMQFHEIFRKKLIVLLQFHEIFRKKINCVCNFTEFSEKYAWWNSSKKYFKKISVYKH